ncbi:hypothetical protein [Paracoccus yeei]|uniref:Uncharacterized protein n=1 Tax=Paracoccus yeei TaxID=147645 RepID=A0A386UHE4_9RHOB|nr:hypothetical protein PY32053_00167 [Paracoccus yeei]
MTFSLTNIFFGRENGWWRAPFHFQGGLTAYIGRGGSGIKPEFHGGDQGGGLIMPA